MVIRKVLAGLAAAGLVFGSTAAAAAPSDARTGSPVGEAEGLSTFAIILGLLIIAGVIGVIASDNGEDLPASP